VKNTVERVHPRYFKSKEKYLLYLRHVFAYEYVLDRVTADSRVLEIGFGDGYGTAMIAEKAATVTAIDVSDETVASAKERYSDSGIDFLSYDGNTIPFEEGTFDLVVALQVIEHIQDDARFVAEAGRVLNDGGQVILTTPNRRHRVPPGEKIWNKFHVREYLADELEALLRAQFEEVSVMGVQGDDEARRLEIDRVKRALTVRKMIPDFIKRWTDAGAITRYSTDNFHVATDGADDSIDLLAVCVK